VTFPGCASSVTLWPVVSRGIDLERAWVLGARAVLTNYRKVNGNGAGFEMGSIAEWAGLRITNL